MAQSHVIDFILVNIFGSSILHNLLNKMFGDTHDVTYWLAIITFRLFNNRIQEVSNMKCEEKFGLWSLRENIAYINHKFIMKMEGWQQ